MCRSRWARRKTRRCVALRVLTDELDSVAQPQLGDERLDRRDETAGHEQAGVGMSRQERSERPQCQLEAIRLGLVAAQEQHRPAGGWALRRREVVDVDGVRQHLPRSARLAEEEVGRALRELALVENVVGGEERSAQRSVDRLGAVTRPARVADTVLVHDDGNPATPREREAADARSRGSQVEPR